MAVIPVRAVTGFFPAGGTYVAAGDLFRSDDPIVKRYQTMFESVNDLLGIVETATKNPGQKRAAKKPQVEVEADADDV